MGGNCRLSVLNSIDLRNFAVLRKYPSIEVRSTLKLLLPTKIYHIKKWRFKQFKQQQLVKKKHNQLGGAWAKLYNKLQVGGDCPISSEFDASKWEL